MMNQNPLPQSLLTRSLVTHIRRGACTALILSSLFLAAMFYAGDVLAGLTFREVARQLLPILTVTIGGGIGGMLYYLFVERWSPNDWRKSLAVVLSIALYITIIWFAMIAGFSAIGQWD